MTQIEQIRAEIERLKAETFNKINHDKNRSMVTDVANSQRIAICEQLLHFIDSLPAEQPSERLGDEIDNFRCSDEFALARRAGEEVASTARHFAQWQKEQIMKSAIEVKINRDTLYNLKPIIHEKYQDLKIGDKILIIKEDEK